MGEGGKIYPQYLLQADDVNIHLGLAFIEIKVGGFFCLVLACRSHAARFKKAYIPKPGMIRSGDAN